MIVEETFDKWCNTSQPMDLDVIKILAISAMKEYARLMCDKQKEICSIEAETKDDSNPHSYESYYVVDRQSILNAPYPDELV